MKQHIILRSIRLADYILDTKATVREASKIFGISKSTVHKDVSQRLQLIDLDKYYEVKKVLDFNLSERHIRGGSATKEKYENEKNIYKNNNDDLYAVAEVATTKDDTI